MKHQWTPTQSSPCFICLIRSIDRRLVLQLCRQSLMSEQIRNSDRPIPVKQLSTDLAAEQSGTWKLETGENATGKAEYGAKFKVGRIGDWLQDHDHCFHIVDHKEQSGRTARGRQHEGINHCCSLQMVGTALPWRSDWIITAWDKYEAEQCPEWKCVTHHSPVWWCAGIQATEGPRQPKLFFHGLPELLSENIVSGRAGLLATFKVCQQCDPSQQTWVQEPGAGVGCNFAFWKDRRK